MAFIVPVEIGHVTYARLRSQARHDDSGGTPIRRFSAIPA